MTDIIDRAKALLARSDTRIGRALFHDLIAELEAARAENERLRNELTNYTEFAEQEFARLHNERRDD